jgi:hypothetical protein
MQTKKLATIFMVGALSVLLLTFVSIQNACAGGHSAARVTTPHAGPTNTANSSGARLTKDAGPQNTGDGQQSGSGNAPTNEGGGGHPHHPDQ